MPFCPVCNDSNCTREEHEIHEPVQVVLMFDNLADKRYFLSQLSDGWGENYVNLVYMGKLDLTPAIHVKPIPECDL